MDLDLGSSLPNAVQGEHSFKIEAGEVWIHQELEESTAEENRGMV